ncbi:MAG: glycosyltransferase [Helicobacter sp.]|nr:glycosyltransferase [Helicobacter sp.]
MKIAILLYSMGAGGAERITSLLLEELAQKHPITLVLLEDIVHYPLPAHINKVILGYNRACESGIKKLLKLPFLAYQYAKVISDCTHSFSLMTRPNYINILAGFLVKKPKIFISERSMPSKQYGYGDLSSKINQFLIASLYPKADKISANSPLNLEDLIQHFKIPKEKTTLLQNCFNLQKIQEQATKESQAKERISHQKAQGDFIFISIGRLDKGKNHQLLIESFAKLSNPKAHLFIIGKGVLEDFLKAKIQELGLEDKISLLGECKNPYAPLSLADCFIFGSNHEGFPNVLVESLALGIPIISTDCMPHNILEPSEKTLKNSQNKIAKCGILTPLNNQEEMTKAMEWIMQNPHYFLPQELKNHSQQFDISTQIPLYKQWLELV